MKSTRSRFFVWIHIKLYSLIINIHLNVPDFFSSRSVNYSLRKLMMSKKSYNIKESEKNSTDLSLFLFFGLNNWFDLIHHKYL